jgi:hypothetical protein
MSKHLSFKEVAVRYLKRPTKKLGRAKNPNAYSTLEWMYEKRPSMILLKGGRSQYPMGGRIAREVIR